MASNRHGFTDTHTLIRAVSPGMGSHKHGYGLSLSHTHTACHMTTGLNADCTKHAADHLSPREGDLGAPDLPGAGTVRAGAGGVAHVGSELFWASVLEREERRSRDLASSREGGRSAAPSCWSSPYQFPFLTVVTLPWPASGSHWPGSPCAVAQP